MTTQTDTSRKGTYQAGLARIRAERATRKPQEGKPKPKDVARLANNAARWATLNQFVDLISGHLPLPARSIWLDLFRNARGGLVDATTRQLAKQSGLDVKTVTYSLSVLRKVGLVSIVRSGHSKMPSRYSVHAHPSRCLQRVMDAKFRDARGRNLPRKNGGGNRGKRSNA